MATDQALVELLTTEVLLLEMERDSLGNATPVGSQAVSSHVEYKRTQTYDRSGEKVIASAVIFFDDDVTFNWTVESEWEILWISQGLRFKVVAAEAIIDPRDGTLHHWEMLCI